MWQWLMTWRDKVRLQMKRARSSDAKRSTKELQVQTVVDDDWDNKNWPLHLPASSLSPVGDRAQVQGHVTGEGSDAELCYWLEGLCPLLQGHGRGFHQTCFLCQKCFKKRSDLNKHIALHHVFLGRPYRQFQPASRQVVSYVLMVAEISLHKELTSTFIVTFVVREPWVEGVTA